MMIGVKERPMCASLKDLKRLRTLEIFLPHSVGEF